MAGVSKGRPSWEHSTVKCSEAGRYMRIAIDFTAFIPQMTGVDTYLKQLVLHLAKVDQRNQYMIYHNYEDRRFFANDLPVNFSHTSISARPRSIRLISQQIILPVAASDWKADVVHSPSFIMPYIRGSPRHVLTVHDMTSFSHPHCHIALRRSLLYRRMVLASLRRTVGDCTFAGHTTSYLGVSP